MNPADSSALDRARHLVGGGLPPIQTPDLFTLPTFEDVVVSPRFPAMCGPISLRWPTWGDELEIERISGGLGPVSRAFAHFQVLTVRAPGAFYRAPSQGEPQNKLVLALAGLPDLEALIAVYRRFVAWRDNFLAGPQPDGDCPPESRG